MKVKAALNSYMPTIDTDKENIHPNIMRPTPPYPQVSSFCHDISHSSKDWHSRILEPSSREKALSRKLSRMLQKNQSSPVKKEKIPTEMPSQSRLKLGNTLWRYLYERSIQSISATGKGGSDLLEQLIKVSQQICQHSITEDSLNLNSQQTLAAVIDALREYADNRKALSSQF